MALARIITRSQACSRELALDLLARGYAVEIVSPDSLPDNIADLELRVEEEPGNQLVASVEANVGGRSASLDFVHHLKEPMADFQRRAPEPVEGELSEAPVSFKTKPNMEPVELPAEIARKARQAYSPAAPILPEPNPPRAPMAGFVRREPVEVNCPLEAPVDFRTEPHIEPVELPVEIARKARRAYSPPAPILPQPNPQVPSNGVDGHQLPLLDQPPDSSEAISMEEVAEAPSQSLPLPVDCADRQAEPIQTVKEAPPIAPPIIEWTAAPRVMAQPVHKRRRRVRSATWPWRASLIFASVVLLALGLGFGLRRIGATSAQAPEATVTEISVPAAGRAYLLNAPSWAKDPPKKSADIAPPVSNLVVSQPVKSESASNPAPKEATVAHVDIPVVTKSIVPNKPNAITRKPRVSHRNGDGLIAHDTVTYLDPRYKPAPQALSARLPSSKHPSHSHPAARKHRDRVVAASSIVYLKKPLDPKRPK